LFLALCAPGAIADTGLEPSTAHRTAPPPVTALELEPCQLAPEHGRLWRITGIGGADNFLLATLHLGDPRVLNLPPAVRVALAASATLVLEALHDDADERQLRDSMRNPPDVRLSDLLQPGLFERVREILGDAGYAEGDVQRYKPWAAALLVAYPQRGQSVYLDRRLYLDARAAGKRTLGLESLGEQAAVFNELPPAEQIEWLSDAVEQHAGQENVVEEIITAYLDGNLHALRRQYREQMLKDDEGGSRQLHRKLVEERNHVMARRLTPLLQEGGVFVAVGALHLPGQDGLLSLLRRQGASVRPVTVSD
jgi:uncharacterized protein YbaP (TraB family)